jgi:hypothetical protein
MVSPSPSLPPLTVPRRYNFNDSSVHEVAAEEAVSSKAYVLFYKRRSAPPSLSPLLSDLSLTCAREGSLKWAGAVPLPEPLTG